MKRLWSRVGVRATSVGLLVLGVIGGVYIGQDRDVQQRSTQAQLVGRAQVDEEVLLKERHGEHAAARAWQRQAENAAAAKAAGEARAAAGKARKLEQKVIAKKAAEKKAKEAAEAAESGSGSSSAGGGTVEFTGPVPESCNEFSGNREIGCSLMIQAGFDIEQFGCLNKLWDRESGWNHRAENPSSGAYGVPQALPGSKMASKGDDWRTNPATQIKWGLSYIKGRYNTPCGAWNHSEDVGWY